MYEGGRMECKMISWFKKRDSEQSGDLTEVADKGIPYKIFGPGIMVADAGEIRRAAKKQFDAANRVKIYKKKDKVPQ